MYYYVLLPHTACHAESPVSILIHVTQLISLTWKQGGSRVLLFNWAQRLHPFPTKHGQTMFFSSGSLPLGSACLTLYSSDLYKCMVVTWLFAYLCFLDIALRVGGRKAMYVCALPTVQLPNVFLPRHCIHLGWLCLPYPPIWVMSRQKWINLDLEGSFLWISARLLCEVEPP